MKRFAFYFLVFIAGFFAGAGFQWFLTVMAPAPQPAVRMPDPHTSVPEPTIHDPGRRRIGSLKPGEGGWVHWTAVYRDPSGRWWLNPMIGIVDQETAAPPAETCVVRTRTGWRAELHGRYAIGRVPGSKQNLLALDEVWFGD